MVMAERCVLWCEGCGAQLGWREHNRLHIARGVGQLLDSRGRTVVECPRCGRRGVVRRVVEDGVG